MEEASASAIVRVVALFYHVGKGGKDYCHKEKMRVPISRNMTSVKKLKENIS